MKLLYATCFAALTVVAGFFSISHVEAVEKNDSEYVTVAILAKDKAHTLPLYLSCLERQTWPASKTYLYIRTNNNTDETAQILRDWISRVEKKYAQIYFDDTDVAEQVQQFGQHEWNHARLKVICTLRQESFDWAKKNGSHYFVADCDNFIDTDVIETMMQANLPIVAPFLRCSGNNSSPFYSNYHYAIDANGYYAASPLYYNIFNQEVKGFIEVPVVHCTYFVRREVLDKLTYDDDSWRYDYVIFSHSARKTDTLQYLDNRRVYGYLTFAENKEDFEKEPFFPFFH